MEDINWWELNFKACCYSDRLLNKLLLLNEKAKTKVDIQEIKKAIYYARKYHGDQKRQSGELYYSHPLEVAYMVSDYLFRTDIIVTSILHDTIEDTKLTKDLIELIFGSIVASQVEDLTRVKKDRKISSAEMLDLLLSQKKYDLLLIKQLDRLHNIQTVSVKSPEKIKKIVEETLVNFMTVAIYLGIPTIEQELSQFCSYAFIQKDILPSQNQHFSFNDSSQLLSLIFQNDVIHTQIPRKVEPL